MSVAGELVNSLLRRSSSEITFFFGCVKVFPCPDSTFVNFSVPKLGSSYGLFACYWPWKA